MTDTEAWALALGGIVVFWAVTVAVLFALAAFQHWLSSRVSFRAGRTVNRVGDGLVRAAIAGMVVVSAVWAWHWLSQPSTDTPSRCTPTDLVMNDCMRG